MTRTWNTGRTVILLSTATLLLGVLIAVLQRPIRVAYHTREFDEATHEVFFMGGTGADSWESYEHHRDQLVRLGALTHRRFVFAHIRTGTGEGREVWRRAMEAFPSSPHTSGTTVDPFEIEVWETTPEMIARWEKFVEDHDVPDFRERYMEPRP